MLKIMFVCLGNICRSPMAEYVLRDMAEKQGFEDRCIVSSAATSTDEIINGRGNPVYPPAQAELKKHGITCTEKRAVQLKKEDYGTYDLFIGMDSSNIRDMHRILGEDKEGKIHKMSEFSGTGRDVADPWFYGNFDKTYDDVRLGCEKLAEMIINGEI